MLVPNYRIGRTQKQWHEGTFRLEPCNHEVFHRTMRRAQLTLPIEAGGMGEPILPYVWDASIVIMDRDWMRVSGFYFDDHSKISVAQTWHVVILARDYPEWVSIDLAEKAKEYDKEMARKAAEKK
jgi:hypothetical protein